MRLNISLFILLNQVNENGFTSHALLLRNQEREKIVNILCGIAELCVAELSY